MPPSQTPPLFICGTDTNVGKTLVLGAILSHLSHTKKDFYFSKPFESGVCKQRGSGKFVRPDTDFLCRMSGNRFAADEVNFYHFAQALAPGIAAKLSRVKMDFGAVTAALKMRAQKHDLIFIEGAGGLLAPLAGKRTNLDLIKALNAQVLLVSRLELGAINHTCLTFDRLQAENVKVKGLILNQTRPKIDLAGRTNPNALKNLGLPLIAVMPYMKSKNRAYLKNHLPAKLRKLF